MRIELYLTEEEIKLFRSMVDDFGDDSCQCYEASPVSPRTAALQDKINTALQVAARRYPDREPS